MRNTCVFCVAHARACAIFKKLIFVIFVFVFFNSWLFFVKRLFFFGSCGLLGKHKTQKFTFFLPGCMSEQKKRDKKKPLTKKTF